MSGPFDQGTGVQARREALGLSQVALARWLEWKRPRVSEVESDRRRWPAWAEDRLHQAEDLAARTARILYEAGTAQASQGLPVVMFTYRDDAAMRADWPDLDGLPAVVHRVAAAAAAKALRDQGHQVLIVEAVTGQDLS